MLQSQTVTFASTHAPFETRAAATTCGDILSDLISTCTGLTTRHTYHGRGCDSFERARIRCDRRHLTTRRAGSSTISKAHERSLRSRLWPTVRSRQATTALGSAAGSLPSRCDTKGERSLQNTKRVPRCEGVAGSVGAKAGERTGRTGSAAEKAKDR